MKFKKFKTKKEADKYVGDIILDGIKKHEIKTLGLATGSTPIGLYKYLVDEYATVHTSWSHVTTFNLDEYVGVAHEDKSSYHYFMEDNLFKFINIDESKTHFPDGKTDYDKLIKDRGGIDLQILGIGINGHIGFNEPGTPANSVTAEVSLAQSTIEVNAHKFFNNDTSLVPKTAYSMGLSTIYEAKKIILIAYGESKHEAISKLKGAKKFDANFPASILFNHPDCTIVIDDEVGVEV